MSTQPAHLLITGISGFLGWHLAQTLQSKHPQASGWQVYGTYHRAIPDETNKPSGLPHLTRLPIDLTDFAALRQMFQTLQPAAVIHTAAQSKPNRCEQEPETSYAINVTATLNLAGLCADAEIPFVFTSTDLVFDGLNAPYSEADPVSPISHYGEQKVQAEQGILERHPHATICRMPLMFGAAPAPSFLQDFLSALQAGKELRLFVDEFRTPVSGRDAAKGLLLALEKRVQGRLHLGGKERLSRYEFGQYLVDVFQLENARILPGRQSDLVMGARRSPDTSLKSDRAFKLGYAPGGVKEELEAIATRYRIC